MPKKNGGKKIGDVKVWRSGQNSVQIFGRIFREERLEKMADFEKGKQNAKEFESHVTPLIGSLLTTQFNPKSEAHQQVINKKACDLKENHRELTNKDRSTFLERNPSKKAGVFEKKIPKTAWKNLVLWPKRHGNIRQDFVLPIFPQPIFYYLFCKPIPPQG